MKKMKKTQVLLAVVLIALATGIVMVPTVVEAQGGSPSGRLTVWSFTDELENMINNYYRRAFRNVTVNYTLIPSDQFERRIDPVLQSGRGAPDVFALEAAFVRKYVESGLLLDISDIYERNKNKLLEYPAQVGTHNGRVYAMSWQATPGAMFYRRSLARQYLGTDDPAAVQAFFNNFPTFLRSARQIHQRSNGRCVIVAANNELYNVYLGSRTSPWIVNGRLIIDPNMEAYMDMVKTLQDNRYSHRAWQWSEDWFNGMNGYLRDERGNPLEVFSYFLPTWGLHYVLKTNAPDTAGDWAMIQGPAAWRWGGTWLGAHRGTQNANTARHMIEWLTTDDGFLEAWARDTGDLVSNTNVINRISSNHREPFLGGQNHYAAFAEMAMNVDGTNLHGADSTIEAIFHEAVQSFVNGERSKNDALRYFRTMVSDVLGIN